VGSAGIFAGNIFGGPLSPTNKHDHLWASPSPPPKTNNLISSPPPFSLPPPSLPMGCPRRWGPGGSPRGPQVSAEASRHLRGDPAHHSSHPPPGGSPYLPVFPFILLELQNPLSSPPPQPPSSGLWARFGPSPTSRSARSATSSTPSPAPPPNASTPTKVRCAALP